MQQHSAARYVCCLHSSLSLTSVWSKSRACIRGVLGYETSAMSKATSRGSEFILYIATLGSSLSHIEKN